MRGQACETGVTSETVCRMQDRCRKQDLYMGETKPSAKVDCVLLDLTRTETKELGALGNDLREVDARHMQTVDENFLALAELGDGVGEEERE